MSAARFRKKPVVVEAVQFKGSTSQVIAIRHWMEGGEYLHPTMQTRDMTSFTIQTLEGGMSATAGDWIIKGTAGEFYPCKPDIVAAIYEPESGSTGGAVTDSAAGGQPA